jgi:hypothetical protein
MWVTRPIILSIFLLLSSPIAANSHGYGTTAVPSATMKVKSPAPSNCKKLSTDSDWPANDVWKSELPGVLPIEPNKRLKHPDWVYKINTVEQVQKAVRFAATHNVRLTIINTGHDFMNR